MVLHGSVLYAGPAYNQMPNGTVQRLKSLEYGCLPSYFLTEESSSRLKNVGGLFGSEAGRWQEDLADTILAQADARKDTWNQKIARHDMLSGTLTRVTYENGARLYINYGDQEVTVDDVTVSALGYRITREGDSR